MRNVRLKFWLFALCCSTSCDSGSKTVPQLDGAAADVAHTDTRAGDARPVDAALEDTPIVPQTCESIDADAGVRVRPVPDAAAPCPPPGYATWPMPNSPALPLPNPARFSTGTMITRDDVTGLIWQQSFSPKITWQAAVDLCEALILDGHDDWRLPSRIELVSLIDFSRQPAIDGRAFPLGTPEDYFWSATIVTHDNRLGYSVYFGAGLTAYGMRDGASAHARCVRGGRPGLVPRFMVAPDVVTDRNTGLVWQRRIFETPLVWEQAGNYCTTLALGGLTGWRLPSAKELQTLIDESRTAPMIDPVAFPDTPNLRFWTSSVRTNQRTGIYLDMADGQTEEVGFTMALHVRCVR